MNNNNKLHFLDGLRGWAAFVVLLHHTLFYLLARINPLFADHVFRFITNGRLAVFVFFILSGFVLSVRFIREPEKKSLAAAATSRYFRLAIPVAGASFVAYILMRTGLMYNIPAAAVSLETGGLNTWLASFYDFAPSLHSLLSFSFYTTLLSFDGAVHTYNSNLWTMPYEFAGSMLIYFVLGVFVREKPEPVFQVPLLMVTFVLFCIEPKFACFLFGYFLAKVDHRWRGPISNWKYCHLVFGLSLILPIGLSTAYSFDERDHCIALLALMIVAAALFFKPFRGFLDSPISRFMGRISFPLYLVQIPIICSLSSYLLLALPRYGYSLLATSYIDAVVTVLFTLCCAYAFTPVEIFSIHASKRIAQRLLVSVPPLSNLWR